MPSASMTTTENADFPWPPITDQVVSVEGVGYVYRIPEKLENEYVHRFLNSPGWMCPFIIESFQRHAARVLIHRGYREEEIGFGDTHSSGRTLSRGGFFYYAVIHAQSDETLIARRWFRRFWPYRWIQRAWPYVPLDPDGMRWWHYLWPFIGRPSWFTGSSWRRFRLTAAGKFAEAIGLEIPKSKMRLRWRRRPVFEWGVSHQPVTWPPHPHCPPVHSEIEKQLNRIHGSAVSFFSGQPVDPSYSATCTVCGAAVKPGTACESCGTKIEKCVKCGNQADGICENCEAPLCYDCDHGEYEDVMVCGMDDEGCARRIEERNAGQ